jgi:rSAM/selenodomain-associated transferase 1
VETIRTAEARRRDRPRRIVSIVGGGCLLAATSAMTAGLTTGWLTAVYLAAGLVFVLTIAARPTEQTAGGWLVWILTAGLAMRLICFAAPPRHETDFHRYLWEGALVAQGHNPYLIRPQDAPGRPALAALTTAGKSTLERVDHPHLTSIYPPVAQATFALAYRLAPFSTVALRAVFLAFDLAVLAWLVLVLRRLGKPLSQVAIYWWNPIVVKEFYLAAHMDAVVIALALAAVTAALWRCRRRAMGLLGIALGAKLWPVVLAPLLLRHVARSWKQWASGALVLGVTGTVLLWPLLASWQLGADAGLHAYAHHWTNNAGMFSVLRWAAHRLIADWTAAENAARLLAGGLLMSWLGVLLRRPTANDEDFIRRCLWAVGAVFLLSPTQFPWYYTWLLPLLAVTPSWPLLWYTALLPLYHVDYDHKWVLWLEHLPVWALLLASLRRWRPAPTVEPPACSWQPPPGLRVGVVIPAWNEERAIGSVLRAIPPWVTEVVVADNGSTDRTAAVARAHGATVVSQPERGYGAACLAGIGALNRPDIVVFLDADFSDDPEEMNRLVEPIARDEADFVIGSRVLGEPQPGALSPQQRFGNALACGLIRLLHGARFTDLGPFRAIGFDALQRLEMDDRNFGWTVQMQVRAARRGLRTMEVPVRYRPRVGVSKISGTVRGVVLAGAKILHTIGREACRPRPRPVAGAERLIVFARYPRAGHSKTRLTPLLGAAGAARLHRQLVEQTLHLARAQAALRGVALEVRGTGDDPRALAGMFGRDLRYRDQGEGDLGDRLRRAVQTAFDESARRVVVIGTDCPLLGRQQLTAAFVALTDHDVVLGPAQDGGYYLIGLNRPCPELFADIPWGGPLVLRRTVAAAARLGLRVHRLAVLPDVDQPADIATWAGARLAGPTEPPRYSVIIAARHAPEHLAATIGSVLACAGAEIIVVVGHSADRTAEVARQFGATVMDAPPLRDGALHTAAARARGDVLLFLRAGAVLPLDYASRLRAVLDQPGTVAGVLMRAEGGRWRWGRRSDGVAAVVLSARVYRACGGFPDPSDGEDAAMLARLRRLGRVRFAATGRRD